MLANLSRDFLLQLIVFQGLVLLILLRNIWLLRRARRHNVPLVSPLVSVLIPAYNEERSIQRCLESLLAQHYPALEILVYDDHSTDATPVIVRSISNTDSRLTIVSGAANPPGKARACAELARRAQGALLLFTDADTFHQPAMLRQAVTALLGENADLLSGFPRQEVRSWGERLLVPFFGWACLCFLPLGLAFRLRLPALSCAVGQILLFQRNAYAAIGGHARVEGEIVEDLALARNIQAAGLRWRMAHVSDLITCRMYRTSAEAVDGFTKNLFAAFGFRLLPYLFAIGWLVVLFCAPLAQAARWAAGIAPTSRLWEPATCVALALLIWLISYTELALPRWLALLYPATTLANAAVAVRSMLHSITGNLHWKGRRLPPVQWRWL